MRKVLLGLPVALAAAVAASSGQVAAGRWAHVVAPDQEYVAGNDTWAFQLVLLTWIAASSAVLGAAAARIVTGDSRARYAVLVPAAVGALAPAGIVSGWAAHAGSVGEDALSAAVLAMVLGSLVGAAFGAAVLSSRAFARAQVVWIGFVWLVVAVVAAVHERGGDVVAAHPLGIWIPSALDIGEWIVLVAIVPQLVVAGFLGWWSTRSGHRLALVSAVSGPLLLIGVHLVVPWLPGGRSYGDHYNLESDTTFWVVITVLGVGAAAVGSAVARGNTLIHSPIGMASGRTERSLSGCGSSVGDVRDRRVTPSTAAIKRVTLLACPFTSGTHRSRSRTCPRRI